MIAALVSTIVIIAIGLIGLGIWSGKVSGKISAETAANFVKSFAGVGMTLIIIASLSIMAFSATRAFANEPAQPKPAASIEAPQPAGGMSSQGLGFLAMAISVGLGSLGAGIAVGMSASAAIGAISENPKSFGSALIFVGMAEGIAIYGMVIAFMILGKL